MAGKGKPGPPAGVRRGPRSAASVSPEVRADLRREYEAARRLAAQARQDLEEQGLNVRGSRGIVPNPAARVWAQAVNVMRQLSALVGDVEDEEEDTRSLADRLKA